MQNESKDYMVHVECKNCGDRFSQLIINKGQLVEDKECPNCGCEELYRLN